MEDLEPRNAKREAIGRIMNLGGKRPRKSTHELSGSARKTRKLDPDSETLSMQQAHELDPDRTTPDMGEDVENLDTQFHRTPATKRSDDGNLEVETSGFPENCDVALPASTKRL